MATGADDLFSASPLPDGARGFLASVRAGGGRLPLYYARHRQLAETCRKAGLLLVRDEGGKKIARLNSKGQRLLDRLARCE